LNDCDDDDDDEKGNKEYYVVVCVDNVVVPRTEKFHEIHVTE